MQFDLSLEALKTYLPLRTEPADFDSFWAQTLTETRKFDLNACFTPVACGLKLLDVFDATFCGYGGQPIKGWFLLPRDRNGQLPCVVEYIGYGGGRGKPLDWLLWSNAGYAHFVMDSRGQGSSWQVGDTPDLEPEGSNPQFPGFMTRGILRPETYYYRRLITDAVRAVEAARANPLVDKNRVAVLGNSQGGGVSLAAAGLIPDLSAVLCDVPFLCHYRRATEITDANPYNEISQYCRNHRDKIETVFHTLSYFDGLNFAVRANAPALFSTGLMDEICPPSTVFAAYNYYAGEKQIEVWPYNHHEGGSTFQNIERMTMLSRLWQ